MKYIVGVAIMQIVANELHDMNLLVKPYACM